MNNTSADIYCTQFLAIFRSETDFLKKEHYSISPNAPQIVPTIIIRISETFCPFASRLVAECK